MTTQNISGIDALREAIAASAQSVRARATQVASDAEAVQRQALQDATDAAIAARLLQQQHADNLAVINEEAAQVAFILAGTPVAQTPAPVVEVEAPAAPAVAETPVVPVQQAPVAETPVVPAAAPVRPANWQEWGWFAWVLAALGAFLGFCIADGWNVDDWARAQTSTGIGFAFTILWWLGWTAMLGGIFGSIGSWLEGHRHRR